MFNHNDFFTILQFFYDNKDVIGSSDGNSQIIYTRQTQYIDKTIIQTAIQSKLKAIEFFKNVIDIPCHNNPDFNKLRMFILDLHATTMTFITISKNSTNPFSLSNELLHECLRSFGFEKSNLISDKYTKALFLLSLTYLYKIKGTPKCLSEVLKFFGFSNTGIYEWWLTRIGDDLYFEGRLIDLQEEFLDKFPRTRYLNWETFEEINDPHWNLSKNDIIAIDKQPDAVIGLPSITPYFSLSTLTETDAWDAIYTTLSRLLYDQWINFQTTENQPPNDLLIDIAETRTSLLSLYLGTLYSYYEYNDYVKYTHLHNFITREFEITPETDYIPFIFSTPYSYEKLLYWCSIRKDESGNQQPLDLKIENISNGIIPFNGIPYTKHENDYELFPDNFNIDLSGNNSDYFLNYDASTYLHDNQVFFPYLNNYSYFPTTTKYLNSNSENIKESKK